MRLDVQDVPVDLDQAVSIGMLLNELVTNALKHAFPEGERGEVRISFHGTPSGGYRLVVADDGRGMDTDIAPGQLTRLGLSLVSTLVQRHRGQLRVTNEGRGTAFEIEFPPPRSDRREGERPLTGPDRAPPAGSSSGAVG